MATNYLPFARRQVVTLAAGARVSTRITDLAIGGGIRSHLGDLAISLDFDDSESESDVILARIGILGKGYLTEAFYPYPLFLKDTVNESGVWQFPKPYRLYPGQRMKAKYGWGGTDLSGDNTQQFYRPGLQFNGVRVKDGQPVILYDAFTDSEPATNTTILLAGEQLQCPADTPVDLYSVIGPPPVINYYGLQRTALETQFQIWGPDDRAWWDDPTWTTITAPPNVLMNLNKPEWVLDPKDTLTVEFWNRDDAEAVLYVTLRGSYEVE